ncbi:hypothetical protein AVEN_34490-1 [Araneus ventricosus]|uniref:Uncharacterized protein n=1 Tax=Araneus ventricosus TaxID=182803 RepID=A0A4Y2Q7F2_ARAVE|nr:hypothetical protein AVEN_34490-1 [Araneus ventricosus]
MLHDKLHTLKRRFTGNHKISPPKSYYAASSWRGGDPGSMGDVRLEFFLLAGSPKAGRPFHYTQPKHKGNGQSQTSSLGRPRSSANRSCTLPHYDESFAYSIGYFSVGERTLGLGLAED